MNIIYTSRLWRYLHNNQKHSNIHNYSQIEFFYQLSYHMRYRKCMQIMIGMLSRMDSIKFSKVYKSNWSWNLHNNQNYYYIRMIKFLAIFYQQWNHMYYRYYRMFSMSGKMDLKFRHTIYKSNLRQNLHNNLMNSCKHNQILIEF